MAKSQAQQAADAANAALAPQEQGIADAQAQAAQQQAAELASLLGFTNASAEMAKGYAPAVQGVYSNAASTQGALAKGFSDGFRQAQGQQAGDINSFLSQQGAPSGQFLPGDTGAADVMFGIGGYIPGSTFAREGAAFGAAAARYPQTVMGIGMAYQAQVNKRYADLQKQYQSELSQLKAQYPQVYNQQLAQLRQLAMEEQEMELKKWLAKKEWGYKEAQASMPPGANTSLSRAMKHLVDDYGNPILDANGNFIPVTGYNTGGKDDGGLTKKQSAFYTIRKSAFKDTETWAANSSITGLGKGSVTRQQAYGKLHQKYDDQLKALGCKPKAIARMIDRAVIAGYGSAKKPRKRRTGGAVSGAAASRRGR